MTTATTTRCAAHCPRQAYTEPHRCERRGDRVAGGRPVCAAHEAEYGKRGARIFRERRTAER